MELEDKIYNGEPLSEDELQEAIDCYETDRVEGRDRRWTRTIQSILAIKDKLFCVEWEQGLTENQPNEYCNQPYEVERVENTQVITVVSYKRKVLYETDKTKL